MESSAKRVPHALEDTEDSYDSEEQTGIPLTSSRDAGTYVRRGLLGVLLSIVIILASAIAITRAREALTKTQGGIVNLASQPYEVQADVGCSDWKDVMVGSMQRATSALDCLNKCWALPETRFANYQEEDCDAYNGAYAGACYCFSDCKKVQNTCWDLVHTSAPTIVTKLTTPVPAGATSVDLGAEEASYKIGAKVKFSGGGHSESKTVIGKASILLDSPLIYSYPAGATISTGYEDSPGSPSVPVTPAPTTALPVTPAPTFAPAPVLTETITTTNVLLAAGTTDDDN